jgi:hypothetical protein
MLGRDNNLVDIKQVVERCVVELSAQQYLLIFNNAEDTILQSSGLSVIEATDLARCVLQAELYSVIFTIINSDTA